MATAPLRTVFLSSTSRDLLDHREAAYRAIEGLDGWHCVRMEDFGARDAVPLALCLDKVRACDLFVGLRGHDHGSCPTPPDDGLSFNFAEAEPLCRRALAIAERTLGPEHPNTVLCRKNLSIVTARATR